MGGGGGVQGQGVLVEVGLVMIPHALHYCGWCVVMGASGGWALGLGYVMGGRSVLGMLALKWALLFTSF
jgi:hypothetical protein